VSFFTYSNRVGEVVLYLERGIYRYANDPKLRAADTFHRSDFAGAAADPGKVFLLDTLDGAQRGEKHMISIAVCPTPGDPIAIQAILLRFRVPAFDALAGALAGTSAGSNGNGGPDVVMLGRSGGRSCRACRPRRSPRSWRCAPAPRRSRRSARRAIARRFTTSSRRRSWLATVQPMESTGWTLLLLADEAALAQRVTRYGWYSTRDRAARRAVHRVRQSHGRGDRAAPAERERTERERLAAELEALRYQINPHFIANTLNSIKLMASAARAGGIESMTRDLMRMVSDSYAGAGVVTELSRSSPASRPTSAS